MFEKNKIMELRIEAERIILEKRKSCDDPAFLDNISQIIDEITQHITNYETKEDELAENINEGIYLAENGFIKMVNTPATKMFGYSKQEMIDKRLWDFLRPEQRFEMRKVFFKKILKGDGSPMDVECVRKDGSVFWGEISMHIVSDKQKVFGLISDITERKNTEQALHQTELKLRELNLTKDKLFSIIAHDLKSPYNAQLGFLELLLENGNTYTPQQREKFIQTVYHSTKQSFALLDNLLLWSRTQTGKIPYNPVEIFLAQIFEEIIDIQKYAAQSKNIIIDTEFNNENIEVAADYEMLNIILRNLLSNAIKFTPENGQIILGGKLTNDNKTLIYVKDSGVGVAAEDLDKLFNPTSNFSTLGTNNEKGTGIGLILCKEFVERNGGEIWVESKENKGTTIYFTLESFKKIKKYKGNCIHNFGLITQRIKEDKELHSYFTHTLIPFFRRTYKQFSPQDITCFIDEVKRVSEKHQIVEFNPFVDMIISSLDDDDNNQLNICFAEFEKLTDELEILVGK